MLRLIAVVLAVPCLLPASARCSTGESREIFRIRIENSTRGRVQVSIDEGRTYGTVGRVRRHAVATFTGFAASSYVPVGTVAATAVHGIRLKIGSLGSGKVQKPITISIVPTQFDETPSRYGGHVPYGSGIYTDIPAGTAIFRNFAPFVGSAIKLERDSALVDLPRGWQPSEGDVIVIIVALPQPYLRELEFENRQGGAVTATYDDGQQERVATVLRPVKGVGRFDGTSYTGTGLINTNHGGVLTISTAPISTSKLPEGKGRERRGGFEIQPSEHARTQYLMPQAMVVGPVKSGQALEGRAPIFSSFIGLAFDPADADNSFRVQVSLREGPWQPMPQIVGKADDAFAARGASRMKILFPRYARGFLARSLAAARRRFLSGEHVVRGSVILSPSKRPAFRSLVTFMVDGELRGTTTEPPYRYSWDTTAVPNSEHKIEIRTCDPSGREISLERRLVVVENP